MMGFKSGQKELFSYSVDLDQRVHSEHPLRKVSEVLDFGFVREQTACFYGRNGNESVDPVVVMKLMFLLFYDNINSERELMQPIITDSRGPGGEGCGGNGYRICSSLLFKISENVSSTPNGFRQ